MNNKRIREIDEPKGHEDNHVTKRFRSSIVTPFDQLPNEVLIIVCSFLEYYIILRTVALVNRQLYHLIVGVNPLCEEMCEELWSVICDSQSIVVPTSNEILIEDMLQRIQRFKLKNIDLDTMNTSVALKYLNMIDPFVEEFTYFGPQLEIDHLMFPKLSRLGCQNLEEDAVVEMFCKGDRSRFKWLYLEDPTTISSSESDYLSFNHLEILEMNSIESPQVLADMVNNNYLTLKEMWYNVDELDEGDFSPLIEAVCKCENLKIFEFGNVSFQSFRKTIPTVFNHLKVANFRGTTSFISKFFSVHHPHLRTVILGISAFDGGDLLQVQLQSITSFWLYIWVDESDYTPVGKILSRVNPKLQTLRLCSQYLLEPEYFARLTQLKEINIQGDLAFALIPYLVKNNSDTLDNITIVECEDVDLGSIREARNLSKFFVVDSTLRSREVHDLFFIIYNHTNLRSLCLAGNFEFFKICMALKQSISNNATRRIERIEAGQTLSKVTELFYLLPNCVEQVDIFMTTETTLEEWLLVSICCHFVSFQVGFRFESFPLQEVLSRSSIISFSSSFMHSLKSKLIQALNNPKLLITQQEKQRLAHDYNTVFQSTSTFDAHRHKYPALSALYLAACEQFARSYTGTTTSATSTTSND
jgi:hypothetical protein